MCTNAEFKLLLSQQTIQQSILAQDQITQFRTPLSPKQSSNKEPIDWIHMNEGRLGARGRMAHDYMLRVHGLRACALKCELWGHAPCFKVTVSAFPVWRWLDQTSNGRLCSRGLENSNNNNSVQEICKYYEKVEYCRLVGIVCTQRAGEITMPPARQVRIETDSDPISNCASPVSSRARVGQIRALEWAPLKLWY